MLSRARSLLTRPSPSLFHCPALPRLPQLHVTSPQPKLKWYSEGVGADGDAVRAQLRDLIAAVVQHMLQPEAHGLTPPKL